MKHLARHLERLGACFARLPDPRRGRNTRYAMADIAMAALSVFFMQSPSFLAHQRTPGRAPRTLQRAYSVRPRAHPVRQPHPTIARRRGPGALRRGALRPRRGPARARRPVADAPPRRPGAYRLGRHAVLPLTQAPLPELFDPQTRRRRNGVLPSDGGGHRGGAGPGPHAGAAAGVRAPPGRRREAGLRTPSGQALAATPTGRVAPNYARCIWATTSTPASRCARRCSTAGGDFLLTAKPDSHTTLYEYLHGIALPEHRSVSGRGARRRIHRYRWLSAVPLRDGDGRPARELVRGHHRTARRPSHLPRHPSSPASR